MSSLVYRSCLLPTKGVQKSKKDILGALGTCALDFLFHKSPKKRSVHNVLEHFWDERNEDIGVFLQTLSTN